MLFLVVVVVLLLLLLLPPSRANESIKKPGDLTGDVDGEKEVPDGGNAMEGRVALACGDVGGVMSVHELLVYSLALLRLRSASLATLLPALLSWLCRLHSSSSRSVWS